MQNKNKSFEKMRTSERIETSREDSKKSDFFDDLFAKKGEVTLAENN